MTAAGGGALSTGRSVTMTQLASVELASSTSRSRVEYATMSAAYSIRELAQGVTIRTK